MKQQKLVWVFVVPVLAALLCCLFLPPAGCEADQKPSVEELIKQLGSERFEEREAATKQLRERKDAAPALRQALKSPDAEVRRRAGAILEEINKAELAALAKNGEVDLLVERMVHARDETNEDEAWQVVLKLVSQLLDLEKKRYGKTEFQIDDEVPFLDGHFVERSWKAFRPSVLEFAKYQMVIQPRRITTPRGHIKNNDTGGGGPYLIRAEEVILEGHGSRNLIVSSGPIRTTKMHTSILLSGHSVEVDAIHSSVIVCDGDLTLQSGLDGCLVVARGRVKSGVFPVNISNCVVVTASTVAIPGDDIQNSVIREKEPQALGLVKFFDPAQHGIEVTPASDGVQVKNIIQTGPFARAGLRANDQILAVDEIKIESPEAFRRALRPKVALGDSMTLYVKREGETIKVKVCSLTDLP